MISQKKQFRNDYNAILYYEKLPNVLGLVEELPYSRKLKIIEKLLRRYKKENIIVALEEYKNRYINIDRVNIFTIENILIGICEVIKNEEERNSL